jgi:RNA polymerase sigma factor (sigma-70 family)
LESQSGDIARWVRLAQAGDADAFGEIVVRFQDMAYACACAYLGDAHLAQDAAQEAFVAAYVDLRAGKLDTAAAFPGWLKTIVRRQCSRLARHRSLPTQPIENAPVEAPGDSPTESEEPPYRAEQQRVAMAALRSLPESYRLVTVLFYFSGYTNERIAEVLGVPLTTVKKRLHDARKKLQQWVVNSMSQNLQQNSPSRDPKFAEKIQRLIQPEALKKSEPLVWSVGMGSDLWEMICAAIAGDLEAIRRLLAKDPALVRAAHDYRTALAFAVRENQLEAAALLIERGADPINSGSPDTLLQIARDRGYAQMEKLLEAALAGTQGTPLTGKSAALIAAIRERDPARVRSLLDASPELLHALDERTNQPIHWAAMTRQLEVIDELHARGADLNAQRRDGARPIQLANGDYHYRGWRDVSKDVTTTPRQVIDHLRLRGADCDICTAAHIGDLNRVRELLDQDPTLANKPSEYVTYYACSGTPLRNAAGAGHIKIVKLLLERGADPNLPEEGIAPRGHALHSAVCNGHIEIVKLLLEHGAYANVDIESSADTLSAAIRNLNQPMIELLCSYGASRAVNLLAYYGDVQTAAAVFAADPAQADDPYALECAAGQGNEAFVRLMLRYQPDLAKRIAVGVRSQGPQAATRRRELCELLFKHGMNAAFADWLRITPLHRFAQRGDVENAEIFIAHGADLDARDEECGSTPLGYAAKFGKIEMVELLLKHGAKTNLPDDPPWATPLAWATRRGHAPIVEMLKKHGAT